MKAIEKLLSTLNLPRAKFRFQSEWEVKTKKGHPSCHRFQSASGTKTPSFLSSGSSLFLVLNNQIKYLLFTNNFSFHATPKHPGGWHSITAVAPKWDIFRMDPMTHGYRLGWAGFVDKAPGHSHTHRRQLHVHIRPAIPGDASQRRRRLDAADKVGPKKGRRNL